jgi:hypothetical protein
MRKLEAMQKKITSLRAQMSAGNLVLPRGSRLVVSMPDDKVITTLEYTGGNEEPTVVLESL